MRLFDTHNHLQDERLKGHVDEIVSTAQQEGVRRMVVNGSCEEDWGEVLDLASKYPSLVLPSFGVHPWYVLDRSKDWQARLIEKLDATPAAIGEIGLDKWILERPEKTAASLEEQEEIFVWQLRLAAERNLPTSIHCLQAWGKLLAILKREPRPRRGFVLHSFGGPREMIGELSELGGYFSLPGYFAHARKSKQRETFRHVPAERLLIETDAPDQCLPEERDRYRLKDESGNRSNHPANLKAVYELAAELRSEPVEKGAETGEKT